MATKQFRANTIRDSRLEMIEKANEILGEYDTKLTVRQLYYQFVSRDLIPNTPRSYQNLTVLITDARYAGLIDWDALEDRGREVAAPLQFNNLRERVDLALRNYRLPRWEDQPMYAELWVEKQALAGVLKPLADRYHAPLMVNKGYCVSPKTRVLTSDLKWVPACAVRRGMELLGVDEDVPGRKKHRRLRLTKTLSVQRFISPRVRVETDCGVLTVSANHPFLVTRGQLKSKKWNNGYLWIEAAKLRAGDRIAKLCEPWEEVQGREAGSLNNAVMVAVYQKSGLVADEIRRLLNKYELSSGEHKGKRSGVIAFQTYGVDRVLKLLGMFRPLRLLDSFRDNVKGGGWPAKSKKPAIVKSIRALRAGPVIGIETDVHTLITEGLVSHNSSASAMYESAERINEATGGGYEKESIIFYLGDHDPSGEDMVRDIQERLEEFGVENLEVRKLALTMTQIKKFRPPPNPAKLSDSRAKSYIEKFGNQSWEVDALPPRELTRIITQAFDAVIDREKMDAVIERENTDKSKLRKLVESITE